jgi:hypothetical protein
MEVEGLAVEGGGLDAAVRGFQKPEGRVGARPLGILAAILLLLLATVAHMARARLNVVQVSAALFYVIVIIRQSG